MVKDICQTTRENLIWVDRYLDVSLFYRYLRDIPQKVKVVLITWPESKRNKTEFNNFMDISKLYQKERGKDNYKLVVNNDIHDRWLRVDENIYVLGGSIKDASSGNYFTLSKIDSIEENFNKINKLLDEGAEI